MHTRFDFNVLQSINDDDFSIIAEPSYDGPGCQAVYICIRKKGQTVVQIFLREEESKLFLSQLQRAIKNTSFPHKPDNTTKKRTKKRTRKVRSADLDSEW